MFYAASHMHLGSVHMTTRLAVGCSARIYAAERHGMSTDTRLLPATQASARAITIRWFVLSGSATFEHEGEMVRVMAPALVALPEHWNEGADGKRTVRIQTFGAPYAVVQVLHREECEGLTQLPLSEGHAQEIMAMHRRILDASEGDSAALLRALLWKLVGFGLVPTSAVHEPDPSMYTDSAAIRMWGTLQRRYTAFDANPSLKAMAAEASLSGRHAHRIMGSIFSECLMPPGGFREATVNMRLSLASMLLSKSTLSVQEVAKLVGYLHPETLANAFRHVGLPSPAEIKRSYCSLLATSAL